MLLLPRTNAPTPIATFVNFQNQPLITNINLVPINSNVERLQLLKKLKQLRHIDQRPSIQSVSIPDLKHVEPQTRPTIVWQETTYQQSTWLTRSTLGQNERSQVPHHRSVLGGN
jgi:hypothetical protein